MNSTAQNTRQVEDAPRDAFFNMTRTEKIIGGLVLAAFGLAAQALSPDEPVAKTPPAQAQPAPATMPLSMPTMLPADPWSRIPHS